jgi:hypothetical protein
MKGDRMERVEKKRKIEFTYKGKKRSIYRGWHEWRFTKDERDHFRRELFKGDRFKKTDVEDLINHLQVYCWFMRDGLEDSRESEIRGLREYILSDCKKTFRHLENIWRGRVWLIPFTLPNLEASTEQKEKDAELMVQTLKKSRVAADSLSDFIKLLESDQGLQKRSVGRPKADRLGFIKKVAEIYRKHVGKPSSYPYGPFYAVVSIALEAAGLPSKYPARGIKAALKA